MNSASPAYDFFLAESPAHFESAAALFKEYAASLNFDLCFQNFDEELKELHIQYNAPSGGLILIRCGNEYVGCAGVRQFETRTAELKRMYIQPAHRGAGLGNLLMEKAIEFAKGKGYHKILLDTVSSMKNAIRVYQKYGFYEIPAYRFNPAKDVLYFEKKLA